MEQPHSGMGARFSDWQRLADAYAMKLEERMRGLPVDEAELARLSEAMEEARKAYAADSMRSTRGGPGTSGAA